MFKSDQHIGAYTDLESLVRLKHQVRGFSFLPRQPIHSLLAGQKASKLRGRGLNFEETRAYLPGDDIRNIDWKATARMRETYTRVYSEERDRPAILVVDQRLAMFFGSKVAMKSVTAAEAAALAAWRVIDVGDRVGAVIFNDTDTDEIRPHRSSKTVMRILEAIVRQNRALDANNERESQPERLNEVLTRVCRLAKHDWLVIVISDFAGADEDTKRLMTRLGQHNDVLAAFVYDPLEKTLPALGRLIVGDSERQIEFDSGDESLRRNFADYFAGRLADAQGFLLSRQIPVIPLDTSAPVTQQIRRLLGSRPRTRRRAA
jgi:uncharacterized protein (DUF58 family)